MVGWDNRPYQAISPELLRKKLAEDEGQDAAVEVVFDPDGGIEAAGDGDFFGFAIGAFHNEGKGLAGFRR